MNHTEPTSYSSEGVRDQTAELAIWALSDPNSLRARTPGYRQSSVPDTSGSDATTDRKRRVTIAEGFGDPMDASSLERPDVIQELSEPVSPSRNSSPSHSPSHSPLQASALTDMLRKSPSQQHNNDRQTESLPELVVEDTDTQKTDEQTPLLSNGQTKGGRLTRYSSKDDLEGQVTAKRRRLGRMDDVLPHAKQRGLSAVRTATNPKFWTPHSVWNNAIVPSVQILPSVIMGLLLNILDALSYGFILFPLGSEIFSETGPDGIAMFYVSCIISQLVYSCGGSIFKGGVGSEMVCCSLSYS